MGRTQGTATHGHLPAPFRSALPAPAPGRQTSLHVSDQKEPFDETVRPRRRQQCFFCDVDKSDEWNFVASLNTFVCKKCNDRISETAPPKAEAEGGS